MPASSHAGRSADCASWTAASASSTSTRASGGRVELQFAAAVEHLLADAARTLETRTVSADGAAAGVA